MSNSLYISSILHHRFFEYSPSILNQYSIFSYNASLFTIHPNKKNLHARSAHSECRLFKRFLPLTFVHDFIFTGYDNL